MRGARTPAFRIFHGGSDITGLFQDRATRIEVRSKERSGEPDEFSCEVDDRDFRLEVPVPGKAISFELGYAELGLADMGRFEIDETRHLGPPATIAMRGDSAGFQDAMKAPAVQNYERMTLGQVIRKAASVAGLSVRVASVYEGMELLFINQFNSAYHQINDLARRFGAIDRYVDGMLLFMERDVGRALSGDALPGLFVQPEDLGSWEVIIDQRPEFGPVQVFWWNEDTHRREHVTFDGFPGLVEELPTYFVNRVMKSRLEAENYARSRAEAFARLRRKITVRLAKGNPWVKAGIPMMISGLRDTVDGSYIIDLATHTYTKDQGLLTVIEAHSTPHDLSDEASRAWLRPNPEWGLEVFNPSPR